MSSNGLIDFCERLGSIDIESIEFHASRGDFESWVRFLGDIELERKLSLIREADLTGDALREKLYETLRSRYDELLRKGTYNRIKSVQTRHLMMLAVVSFSKDVMTDSVSELLVE